MGIDASSFNLDIKIQQNQYASQSFDFTLPRQTTKTAKMSFPSFLHYDPISHQLTYSTKSKKHQYSFVSRKDKGSDQINIVRNKDGYGCELWRLVEDGDMVELQQGQRIKLGNVQIEVAEITISSNKAGNKVQKEADFLQIPKDGKHKISSILHSPRQNIDQKRSYYLDASKVSLDPFASRLSQNSSRLSFDSRSNYSIRPRKSSTDTQIDHPQCRICFQSASTPSNPLLSVCNCTGSVGKIHLQCLQQWIRSKTGRVQTQHCILYSYQQFKCQICKQEVKSQIEHNGRKYMVGQGQYMHPPFVRLKRKIKNKVQEILIRLQQKLSIGIGRGQDNQLALCDPSISRKHCFLYYSNRSLYLHARSSQFGSFVSMMDGRSMGEGGMVKLVYGGSLVAIGRSQERGWGVDCCSQYMGLGLVYKDQKQ